MLKIPAKYKRCGIKVKCLKCKYQVSSKCGLTGKAVSGCEHKDQFRYNLILCVPKNPGVRRSKILETKNFDEAFSEMAKFKREQESMGYNKTSVKKSRPETTVTYFITAYLNAVSGVNTPSILIRKRSKEHIDDSVRAFERFRDSLKKAGYNFNGLDARDIRDEEVSIFHDYIINTLNLGERSYNKHMGILKTLYNWISRVKDYNIPNPFTHVELHNISKDVTIIQKDQFKKFISAITRENGYNYETRKYLYRDWLVPAYRLALETGLRREELLTLSWKDLVPIDGEKLVCRVDNLKVNRIVHGKGKHRQKYIPVTKGLMALLIELGYERKKDSDEYIIERSGQNLNQGMDLLSRCFSHFIKIAISEPMEFGVLRKTYITRLTLVAGPNAKLFTGSSSEEVLKNHYLSTAFMAANLDDFAVL